MIDVMMNEEIGSCPGCGYPAYGVDYDLRKMQWACPDEACSTVVLVDFEEMRQNGIRKYRDILPWGREK